MPPFFAIRQLSGLPVYTIRAGNGLNSAASLSLMPAIHMPDQVCPFIEPVFLENHEEIEFENLTGHYKTGTNP